MRRGSLRVYLGAAPGVGKTFAMLNEGRRRAERGTDVVVGFVETHGRRSTAAQLGTLEVIPRRTIEYRDTSFDEMDVDAILQRRPTIVLVDELAHTNVVGARNEKRWQDVDELLAAGIDVISTVNVQHLESLNDVVEAITGIQQRETVPDEFVRGADQVELIDATPEALRRRMAHGNIYPAERIDAALTNYFRPGNLAALRELALMWLADKVDDSLQNYRTQHGITRPWETRERVVVALTGAPNGEHLVRRAARIAARGRGDLLGVHVRSTEGLRSATDAKLGAQRTLLEDLGGRYSEVSGSDTAIALTQFAQRENATQLVLGASDRSRWKEAFDGSVINDVIRRSGPVDVHVISTEGDGAAQHMLAGIGPRHHHRFSRRRQGAAWLIAVALPPLLTFFLTRSRDRTNLSTDLLLLLLGVVLAAATGGVGPAAFAAMSGFLLANWYLTPPIHQWSVAEPENLLALFTFLAVGILVGWLVSRAAERASDAAAARAEAETLVALAGALAAEPDPLPMLLQRICESLDADAATIFRCDSSGDHIVVSVGTPPLEELKHAEYRSPIDHETVLAFRTRGRTIDEPRVAAFTSHLRAALDRRSRARELVEAAQISDANELRAALLAAVSHDLRTPLASIKASASTLRQTDVQWSAADRMELLETIEDSSDRLTDLITNLMGVSRVQAGVVELSAQAVDVESVVNRAIGGLERRGRTVRVDAEQPPPLAHADPALLERAVANVVDNAIKWSPVEQPVVVRVEGQRDVVVILVIDRGPGIPVADRERVFAPFQRTGDAPTVSGTGLGLAVARGFIDLMDGEITIEDTPGGGTTVELRLPNADEPAPLSPRA